MTPHERPSGIYSTILPILWAVIFKFFRWLFLAKGENHIYQTEHIIVSHSLQCPSPKRVSHLLWLFCSGILCYVSRKMHTRRWRSRSSPSFFPRTMSKIVLTILARHVSPQPIPVLVLRHEYKRLPHHLSRMQRARSVPQGKTRQTRIKNPQFPQQVAQLLPAVVPIIPGLAQNFCYA